MRIGYFTSIEEWGGSETYLKSLMLGVRERGHEPVLFGIDGTRLWDEMTQAGVSCIAWAYKGTERSQPAWSLPSPAGEHGGGPPSPSSDGVRRRKPSRVFPSWLRLLSGNYREMRRLARIFAAHRVDVMHVSVSGYEVAGLACRWVGIPTVAMNMITPPDEPYWARRLLMRYTARRYTHVSSQSQYCTRRWAEVAGLRCDHCSFVWNGADLERYRPASQRTARTPADPFRLISIGRLHPMKAYDVLIDALARLNDSSVTVRILGEGPLRADLETAIRKNGLTKSVALVGFHEAPEEELAAADCFVLPSVSHESCPAVLAEAMACGLPLITSDFGPLAEVNRDRETGLVVSAGNADALADAISRLKADPGLCERLGAAALQRAQLFSHEKMIEKTLGLYRAVMK